MSIVKNENDKLPADMVDDRVATYQGMMNLGYTLGLPLSLGIVMLIALVLLGVSIFNPLTWIVSILTGLGVLGIAKTFFVH